MPTATRIGHLNINGARRTLDVPADATLLSVLRGPLDLTGTKYGCGEGQCFACSVLIDGTPRHSCQMTVGEVGERAVTTIEGLEHDGQLHPVQQAFLDVDAMQCAYCTSGMVLGAVALLQRNPHPSEAEIVAAMDGHLCRCGVYQRIVAAIQLAAQRQSGRES